MFIAALFLFTIFWGTTAQAIPNRLVSKEIIINRSNFEYSKNPGGQLGIKTTISGVFSGVSSRGFRIRVTLRLPNGTPILASKNAPKNMTKAKGRLEGGGTVNFKPGSPKFNVWTFFPFNAMSLPSGTDRIIIRWSIYNGKIGSYYDAEIKFLKKKPLLTRGVMLGNISTGLSSFKEKQSLIFRSSNNVLGCKDKLFYSGLIFKLPNGANAPPSRNCLKKNINKRGQIQVESKVKIVGPNVQLTGKALTFPLSWIDLESSRSKSLIATYFISSGGLWNVREFEVLVPQKSIKKTAYKTIKTKRRKLSPQNSANTPLITNSKSNNSLVISKIDIDGTDLSKTRTVRANVGPSNSRIPRLTIRFKTNERLLENYSENRISRFRLRVNDRHTFYMYCFQKDYFRSYIPLVMFVGQNIKMEITSLDIPMQPYIWRGRIKVYDVKGSTYRLQYNMKSIPEQKWPMERAKAYGMVGSALMELGRYREAPQYLLASISRWKQIMKNPSYKFTHISNMHTMLSIAYAMNGEVSKFMESKSKNLAAIKQLAKAYVQKDTQKIGWCASRIWNMADRILCFTGSEKIAMRYYWEGWQVVKPYLEKKGTIPGNISMAFSFPSMTAILVKNKIDYMHPDRRRKLLANIQEYRDFRGMDGRRASLRIWEKWVEAQCNALVKTVKNYPGVHNRIVIAGETKENINEGLLHGYKKDPMGPLARLLAKDDLPPKCRNTNVYARVTRRSEGRLHAAILKSKTDSLLPKDIMRMSLKACLGSYPMAVLTAHAVLKTTGKLGRQRVESMQTRARQKKWKQIEQLRPGLRPYSEIAKRLRNLRPQNDKTGDKMGPWYHIFGILTAGAIVNPGEAKAGAMGEHFLKWTGSFGKAEGSYNRVKRIIDFIFADAASELRQYGRFPPSTIERRDF